MPIFYFNLRKKNLGYFFVFSYFPTLFNFVTILGNTAAVTRSDTKKTERQNRHDVVVALIFRLGLLRLSLSNCHFVPEDSSLFDSIQNQNY